MRKEYYNYIVKMPAVLHEMFRQKVYDNHFSDMKTVMTHISVRVTERKFPERHSLFFHT